MQWGPEAKPPDLRGGRAACEVQAAVERGGRDGPQEQRHCLQQPEHKEGNLCAPGEVVTGGQGTLEVTLPECGPGRNHRLQSWPRGAQ